MVFYKVEEKVKKIKNSLTKHGYDHYHDHDVYEEECNEQESDCGTTQRILTAV